MVVLALLRILRPTSVQRCKPQAWTAILKKRSLCRDKLAPLHDVIFSETSPGPVKYAMSLMGLCADEVRLPLVEPRENTKEKVREVLKTLGFID